MYPLKSFVEWWNENPYITFTIGIIGLIGFVLGIVFYFKSRARKQVSFLFRRFAIVWSSPHKVSKLKFFYDQNEIENLFASKIVIWNSGELTIDNKDAVPNFPITVEFPPNGIIYEAEITKASHTANNFVLKIISSNKIELLFDYFDKNEGCVIKVLHSSGMPTITGRIKGLKKFSQAKSVRVERTSNGKPVSKAIVILLQLLIISLVIIGTIFKGPYFLVFGVFILFLFLLPLFSTPIPFDLEEDYRK